MARSTRPLTITIPARPRQATASQAARPRQATAAQRPTEQEFEVEYIILAKRTHKKPGSPNAWKFLLKWAGYPICDRADYWVRRFHSDSCEDVLHRFWAHVLKGKELRALEEETGPGQLVEATPEFMHRERKRFIEKFGRRPLNPGPVAVVP